jgi:hypothetical protein
MTTIFDLENITTHKYIFEKTNKESEETGERI